MVCKAALPRALHWPLAEDESQRNFIRSLACCCALHAGSKLKLLTYAGWKPSGDGTWGLLPGVPFSDRCSRHGRRC